MIDCRKVSFIVLPLCIAAFCFRAEATERVIPNDVFSRIAQGRLDNSLRYAVLGIPSRGLAGVSLRVNAGSAAERFRQGAGTAHYVEHMIFRGGKKYTQEEILDKIRDMGGTLNATTSLDTTSFYMMVPVEKLESALSFLKELIFEQEFTEHDFEDEKHIIMREIVGHNTRPSGKQRKLAWQTVFEEHPYRHPPSGRIAATAALTMEDVTDFYQTHYVPENTVVSIVGDREPGCFAASIEKVFSDIENPGYSVQEQVKEPFQTSPRSAGARGNIEEARLTLAFRTVPVTHRDTPILNVLFDLLIEDIEDGLSSKLIDDMGIVRSIRTEHISGRDAGMFSLNMILDANYIEKTEKTVLREIDKISNMPPDHEKVEKAKKRIISSFAFAIEDPVNMANRLSMSMAIAGDALFEKYYLRSLDRIRPEDISRVARQYLDERGLNIVRLIPTDYEKERPEEEVFAERGTIRGIKTKETLESGITLVVHEDPFFRSYAVNFLFPETGIGIRNRKISDLALRMFVYGNRDSCGNTFEQLLRSTGSRVSIYRMNEGPGISIKTTKNDLIPLFDTVTSMLDRPRFCSVRLEKEKENILSAEQVSAEENMFATAVRKAEKILYGMSEAQVLSKEKIEKLEVEDIEDLFRKEIATEGTVVVIAGNILPDGYLDETVKKIGSIEMTSQAGRQRRDHNKNTLLSGSKDINIQIESTETLVALFYTFHGSDQMNGLFEDILKTTISKRLFRSLRTEAGISYSQGVTFDRREKKGYVCLYAVVAPENVSKAISLIEKEVKKLSAQGTERDEFAGYLENSILSRKRSLLNNESTAKEIARAAIRNDDPLTAITDNGHSSALTARKFNAMIKEKFQWGNRLSITVGSVTE